MIEIKNVSKHFGGIKAVKNVTLNINKGSITGLIGPNGAGKTTLFNMIAGFYSPDFGEIIFEGENISSLDLAKLISNWSNNNITSVNFAIGGAFGNGIKIKKTADKIIAFGKLTWPHQMVKMMIAEQIYRIETIIQGHPYHK